MATFNRFKKKGANMLLTAGVPFGCFMLGGTYFLSTFLQTHMDIKDNRNSSISKRKFDLEGIFICYF